MFTTFVNNDGRVCTACGFYWFWNEFHKSKKSSTGHESVCKRCGRKNNKTSRRANSVITQTGRECSMCGLFKEWTEYSPKSNGPYGYYNRCKQCNATTIRLKRYGLTYQEYLDLIANHNDRCDICDKQETAITSFNWKVKALAIDHCHESGKIRGMLCSTCNSALGMAKDSVERIEQIIYYLVHNANLKPPKRRKAKRGRDNMLFGLYGIGLQEYDELLTYQHHVCAICGEYPDNGKSLGVDHDHKTGIIRGLLCVNCNTSLGCFQDSVQTMQSAILYLVSNR